MGIILFVIMIVMEVAFAGWVIATKKRKNTEKLIVRCGMLILTIVLLLTGVLQGLVRYKYFIALLIAQILLSEFLFLLQSIKIKRNVQPAENKPIKTGKTIRFAVYAILLYGISLFSAILFPQHKDPQITGPLHVKTSEYVWTDESRKETYTNTGENRFLGVKFWYPEENGKYPLVVFSHGAMGVIDSNVSTCTELASHGYVVASIGYTYQAMFVKGPDGKNVYANAEFVKKAYTENGSGDEEKEKRIYLFMKECMAIRAADENFVLDTILQKTDNGEAGPFTLIDKEHIGLMGHSMGGSNSVEVGRERTDIDAVIDLEGTMFGEYIDFKNGTEVFNDEPYPIPVLDVNSAAIDQKAKEVPGEGYVNFYLGKRAVNYRYEIVDGAGHLNFTDLPLISPALAKMLGVGDVDPKKCIEGVNEMVLEYFDQYLKGKDIENEGKNS